jgi:hypothetical protein
MEFFISGNVLDQVSSCEKQAAPGECFVSAVSWMLVVEHHQGFLAGAQKGNGALANYRLDTIKTPVDIPPPIRIPLSRDMDKTLRAYIPAGKL